MGQPTAEVLHVSNLKNTKLTWEETIQFIRTQPEYNYLVEKAYFEENLALNVERFIKSEEFIETLKLLKKYQPQAKSILDIGSGNGVSAIAFALEGYNVCVVEPDPSLTIGAGAIRKLKEHYRLNNIEIFEAFAEEIKFPDYHFDVVYARQCMHHAYDLNKFVFEAGRVLKKDGLFMTVRDHLIFNEKDKEWFLRAHLLQKFYGGENAFTLSEYISAIRNAGLTLILTLNHFDSPINYFPLSKVEKDNEEKEYAIKLNKAIKHKYGVFSNLWFLNSFFTDKVKHLVEDPHDEKKVPGRMYTFLALKK